MKSIILVSSPLQALVVWLMIQTDNSLIHGKVTIFFEGKYRMPNIEGIEYIFLEETRGNNFKAINNNLRKIIESMEKPANLWVSDILWPMNNAIYTLLNKQNKLLNVNFFDEGMVLYWLEKLSRVRLYREYLKFMLMQYRTGIKFTKPKIQPFYTNDKNGIVCALHSSLLNTNVKVCEILIDNELISQFDEGLDLMTSDPDMKIYNEDKVSALLLSQPYYRVTNHENFKRLLFNAKKYLKSDGCEDLYVKLHPSEGLDIYKEFYEPIGFKNIFSESKSPIEAKLHKLPINTTLISFNSSALLNSRVFGFKGKAISYGLDWIANQYKFQKSIKEKQEKLFLKCGVDVIMDKI